MNDYSGIEVINNPPSPSVNIMVIEKAEIFMLIGL